MKNKRKFLWTLSAFQILIFMIIISCHILLSENINIIDSTKKKDKSSSSSTSSSSSSSLSSSSSIVSDVTPPVMTSISANPLNVYPSGSITVSIGAYDDLSGISAISCVLESPSEQLYGGGTYQLVNLNLSYNSHTGKWEGTAVLPSDAEWGDWMINNILLIDNSSNQRLYDRNSGESVEYYYDRFDSYVTTFEYVIFNVLETIKIAYVTDIMIIPAYDNDQVIFPGLIADPNFIVNEVNAHDPGILSICMANDLVLISEIPETIQSLGLMELEGINKPMLFMKVDAYKPLDNGWGWTQTGGFGEKDAAWTDITVLFPSHPIFTGISLIGDQVQIISEGAPVIKGLTFMDIEQFFSVTIGPGGPIIPIAHISGFPPVETCILEIPAGTIINETPIPQKFLQIGIHSDSYLNVTPEALQIIKNAIYYLMDRPIP